MTPTLAQKYPEAHARLAASGFTEIARLMGVMKRSVDLAQAVGAASSSVSNWFGPLARDPRWIYEKAARDYSVDAKPEPVPEPAHNPRPIPIAAPFPQIQHEKKMLMVAVNGNENQVRKALEFLNCEVFE
jgi:hypothetical protein